MPPDLVLRTLSTLAARALSAGLLTALVAAQVPDGPIKDRDRDWVARLSRAGAQRLDADGGADHVDAPALAQAALPDESRAATAPHSPSPALVPGLAWIAPVPVLAGGRPPTRLPAVAAAGRGTVRGRAPPLA